MVRQQVFFHSLESFQLRIQQAGDDTATFDALSSEWRGMIRRASGLPETCSEISDIDDLKQEFSFLMAYHALVKPVFEALAGKRVLFAGQGYYNTWYLSRGLRSLGWKADVLNWDLNPRSQIYYHGEDISFEEDSPTLTEEMFSFYMASLYNYDIFHFCNKGGIGFGWPVSSVVQEGFSSHAEIYLLKSLGKTIVYSNNGCLDGVSQTAFSKWGPESVCSICIWQDNADVCSDEKNLSWGEFRNSVADYQCLLGGNRVDYNDDQHVHEVPEFYCLDKDIWKPDLEIPDQFVLPEKPEGTIWLYHAVGHKTERTTDDGVNIKSSHIYLPLIDDLRKEGYKLELLSPEGVPNRDVRFIQAQADIFLEMLTYGWFGANAREAMMLGKPVICYLRPEWLESARVEIPEYIDELPIVSATPETVKEILLDLIHDKEKCEEIGQRSRDFAVKWHSKEAGAKRFTEIYSKLLKHMFTLEG